MILRYTLSASWLPSNHLKVAAAQRLSLIRSPDAPYLCEISGLGVPLELEEEAVYTPNLSELVIACGKPLDLACDKAGHWKAAKSTSTKLIEGCETAEDALGRLWLLLQNA
jgi:hypothetical protein